MFMHNLYAERRLTFALWFCRAAVPTVQTSWLSATDLTSRQLSSLSFVTRCVTRKSSQLVAFCTLTSSSTEAGSAKASRRRISSSPSRTTLTDHTGNWESTKDPSIRGQSRSTWTRQARSRTQLTSFPVRFLTARIATLLRLEKRGKNSAWNWFKKRTEAWYMQNQTVGLHSLVAAVGWITELLLRASNDACSALGFEMHGSLSISYPQFVDE